MPWCEWDSSYVSTYTDGGPRTHDEMCLQVCRSSCAPWRE
jgi:hypothetical protein